jgi:hypothetical protein
MKYFRLPIALLCVLYLLHCGEQGDTVVGSSNHSLVIEKRDVPTIIADGVSSIYITAFVVDDSGWVASNMKVAFKTTAGSISDNVMTDNYGFATAKLTSASSLADLDATVTATVVDPKLSLAKTSAFSLSLTTPGFENSISKKSASSNSTDTINIGFLGVTLTATVKDSIMPADGLTQTKLNIKLVESTSQKPVSGSPLVLSCYSSNMDGSTETNDQGIAAVVVIAAETVGIDTIKVQLGPEISTQQTVEYVTPELNVSAKNQSIFADGASQTEIVAVLLTHKNTPVVGATIEFSTTDGRIQASAVTDPLGNATAILVAGENANPNVNIIASFLSVKDSVQVVFVDQSSSVMSVSSETAELLRDGIATAQLSLAFAGENSSDFANRIVPLSADYGIIPDSVITDSEGKAVFPFVADAGIEDVISTIRATYAGSESSVKIKLVGLDVRVTAMQDSIPADGSSQTTIRVSIRQAGSKIPISGYNIQFGVSEGTIEQSGKTNEEGVVEITYTSGNIPGDVDLFIYIGSMMIEQTLSLFQYYPSTIVLSTENSFIWVKETGQIEQTDVTAQLLGATGDLVSDPYKVTFTIIQGPDGGEVLETPSGHKGQSVTIGSVNGIAATRLLSGTRAGAVLVRADITDFPQIGAQSSRVVIRSGPPYMWVSPTDPDSVIQHGTIVVEPGKLNVAFGNPTQEIGVTAYFGDKYNNPVETGTVAYFTTTGGFVSTDAATCELGRTSVVLQNVNPFPVLHSNDPNQITVSSFPNPNGHGEVMDIWVPDFEGGLIPNTIGTTQENDGIATVIVTTNGQNQFGEDIKVWTMGHVVFSVGIHTFHVWTDRTVLAPGQAANIYIEIWDLNGNPVAAGSQLTVSSDEGKITFSDLMPTAESYGWGSTFFTTQLVNTLDPAEDEPKTATVEIKLKSPNGDRFRSFGINLTL